MLYHDAVRKHDAQQSARQRGFFACGSMRGTERYKESVIFLDMRRPQRFRLQRLLYDTATAALWLPIQRQHADQAKPRSAAMIITSHAAIPEVQGTSADPPSPTRCLSPAHSHAISAIAIVAVCRRTRRCPCCYVSFSEFRRRQRPFDATCPLL